MKLRIKTIWDQIRRKKAAPKPCGIERYLAESPEAAISMAAMIQWQAKTISLARSSACVRTPGPCTCPVSPTPGEVAREILNRVIGNRREVFDAQYSQIIEATIRECGQILGDQES